MVDGMTVVQEQVNKSIIIADDDELLRENIVEILLKVGYSVRADTPKAVSVDGLSEHSQDLLIATTTFRGGYLARRLS